MEGSCANPPDGCNPKSSVYLRAAPKTGLVSPAEVEEGSFFGGCFVAPIRDDGSLFPIYRFDFSLYLGRGEFVRPQNGRTTFNGIAVSIADGSTNALHCTFEYPSIQMPEKAPPNQPSWFFQRHEPRIEPLFRVVRGRTSRPLNYVVRFGIVTSRIASSNWNHSNLRCWMTC